MHEHVQCKDLDFLTVPWQERATWLRCGVLRVQCSSSTIQRRSAVRQCRAAEECTQTPTQHLAQHGRTGRCHDAVERCPIHRGHDPEAQCSSEHLVLHWAGAQHQGIGVCRNTEGVCPSLTRLGT